MNVTNRELIAVVGRIGSGKTTLLNALLGELNLLSGKLDVEVLTAISSNIIDTKNGFLDNYPWDNNP